MTTKIAIDYEIEIEWLREEPCTLYVNKRLATCNKMAVNKKEAVEPTLVSIKEWMSGRHFRGKRG